ncbi:TRAP transporter small permease [Limimaricola pyoseonensis]|uniref:TRAP transporter small permease protein n=1 Tax=Limimaricola pyoseonensis TaxID=521013 RepID=A0A1G7HHX0_9RHOB|nr:TRAP transporter small permease subunit [Limimaricola pyoseonensis]SDE99998.1 TRAP-type C4-dicarboxylate transport system, small permease component [Limimaricola pyoseonensis]
MLRQGLQVICTVLLGALVTVPLLQVVMRDLFGAPLIGAEELTRFLLICTVFLAYPLVVAGRENIVMAELREALPDRLRRALHRLIGLAALAGCGLMAWVALGSIIDNPGNATPTLKIPFWLFLGAACAGFGGAALVHLRQALSRRPTPTETGAAADSHSVSL